MPAHHHGRPALLRLLALTLLASSGLAFFLPTPAAAPRAARAPAPAAARSIATMPQCRSAPMVALGAASDDASADGNEDGETVYEHERVVLRVYDIGGKYTPMMSALLMKEMPAIWHVGIGVFGREYWFSTRIESKALSETETAFGMAPERTHDLGRAVVDVEAFERHIEEVLQEAYNMDTYQVFENNCNDFAAAAVRFLTGGEVEMPAYILENSQNALSEMPKGQAALTRSIANQVARVVMLAWGTANRSKEENAKREARRLKPQ